MFAIKELKPIGNYEIHFPCIFNDPLDMYPSLNANFPAVSVLVEFVFSKRIYGPGNIQKVYWTKYTVGCEIQTTLLCCLAALQNGRETEKELATCRKGRCVSKEVQQLGGVLPIL